MTQFPQTGSNTTYNGSNRTNTSLSTNILITVATPQGNKPVGAIQQLVINEKRNVKMIDEVGTDGHIDSAPQASTNISGSCQRVRFDASRIAEAFARGFIHVSSQAYPFDIVILDKSRSDTGSQITTFIKNVWITGIDVTYSATDWVIVESMTWEAEHIYSYLNNAPDKPAATGGFRHDKISKIPREQDADRGADGRRGALDADGLLDLGSDGSLY